MTRQTTIVTMMRPMPMTANNSDVQILFLKDGSNFKMMLAP